MLLQRLGSTAGESRRCCGAELRRADRFSRERCFVSRRRLKTYWNRKIEQRLGPCIWLEAGINSPIIRLVQRAVQSPTQHVFEGLRPKCPTEPMSAVCSATLNLWREGIAATFWKFKTPQQNGISQIWIPPYQIEKTSHWTSYKDPVIEALRSRRPGDDLSTYTDHVGEGLKLLSSLVSSSRSEEVTTSTERFVKIVSGLQSLANRFARRLFTWNALSWLFNSLSGPLRTRRFGSKV